ncbi:hypothetical protein NMG60_11024349 [Bertholletia excelsa]
MEAGALQFKVVLGSSSVHRRKLLAEMGYDFTVMTADIDEKSIRNENPEELVMALAEAKAEAIISRLPIDDYKEETEPSVLITCDQVVVYEGTIREKPSSKEEAREFIKGYSDKTASTVSSVLVTNLKNGFRRGGLDKVEIHFVAVPDQVIDSLIEEGIVLNVAGGLMIEHPLIQPYVKEVAGAIDSVKGLPKALTEKLIREVL